MCRIPKVVVVAPADRHADLRRALSSLEYDIAATVATAADAKDVEADVAVVWEPGPGDVSDLSEAGLKTVAIGGESSGADMQLSADDVGAFKSRVWELFRPG